MRFRFETILRLRKIQENLVQRDMALVNNHILKQEDHLHSLEEMEKTSKQRYNRVLAGDANVNTLRLYNSFFTGTKLQEAVQRKIIGEATAHRETKRKTLTETMRRRRTMEILKERHTVEHYKIQMKLETELLNEVALNQWRLNSI
jgi:flagellar export protein FliJ